MLHFNEILIVLIVILILFGSGKFPKIMENLAEGIKSFKKAMNTNKEDNKKEKKSSTKTNIKTKKNAPKKKK